jgi:predicted methyltransferase
MNPRRPRTVAVVLFACLATSGVALTRAPVSPIPPAAAAEPTREEKLKALVGTDYPDIKEAVRAAMAGPHRKEGRYLRDPYRHPVETLSFYGLTPNMKVLELSPGGGWYTEILAPVLHKQGKLYVTVGEGSKFGDFLGSVPEVYGKVEKVQVDYKNKVFNLGPEGSLDMVVTFRNLHNWMDGGYLDEILQASFKVLKKGGVFGVVEHRARQGATPEEGKKSGYMPQAWVIQRVTAAGFKLAGKSEVNANPKDKANHPEGVWTLPPTYALGAKDREKYAAIGESDRMTLRFVKP